MHGIGGTVQPLGGGFVDFYFPGFRVRGLDPVKALQWEVTRAAQRTGAVTDGRLASVGSPLTPRHLAERLNVFGHDQLLLMQSAVDGVAVGAPISATTDYSGGLQQRANGRKRAAHAKLNIVSWQRRVALPPGAQWWADIGHLHPPDWNGDTYTRTFAEERSGTAIPL